MQDPDSPVDLQDMHFADETAAVYRRVAGTPGGSTCSAPQTWLFIENRSRPVDVAESIVIEYVNQVHSKLGSHGTNSYLSALAIEATHRRIGEI